jgi:hypothetical protein
MTAIAATTATNWQQQWQPWQHQIQLRVFQHVVLILLIMWLTYQLQSQAAAQEPSKFEHAKGKKCGNCSRSGQNVHTCPSVVGPSVE